MNSRDGDVQCVEAGFGGKAAISKEPGGKTRRLLGDIQQRCRSQDCKPTGSGFYVPGRSFVQN